MSETLDESLRARRTKLSAASLAVRSGRETLSVELALTLFRHMVRTRALEERAIKMSKSGEAYFWIGGPGEEAFNVCLGLQVHKGRGPAHDFLHLHYRSLGILLAMGLPMVDHVRQLAMTATDPFSRGRNFVGHYATQSLDQFDLGGALTDYGLVPDPDLEATRAAVEAEAVMGPLE